MLRTLPSIEAAATARAKRESWPQPMISTDPMRRKRRLLAVPLAELVTDTPGNAKKPKQERKPKPAKGAGAPAAAGGPSAPGGPNASPRASGADEGLSLGPLKAVAD